MSPEKHVRHKTEATGGADAFSVIGIGASAGGLETLEAFLSHVPSAARLAVVIIQHLSPEHKSLMGSLLEKYTRMGVSEIADGAKVRGNGVYLAPPNRYVRFDRGALRLVPPAAKQGGLVLPVDYFFRSMAEGLKDRAIAIILSGTGSDGTEGLRAVKEAGGMVMVQDEAQARYSGMPGSAIQTGLVDFVLPVEKMPGRILKYLRYPGPAGMKTTKAAGAVDSDVMRRIFVLIRNRTGHDFSSYKQTTVHRRIERRMALHQLYSMADYSAYLERKPGEVDALFRELLISVTRFFRDPDAFHALGKKALPALMAKKPDGSSVRVWVPGCSTGEEAYSLAILITEYMEKHRKRLNLQIFASDIDADAIETGRRGVYPENIVSDVSRERLSRFFTREGGLFHVKRKIRDRVSFALQNVFQDPPFSKLDLISCRNVLIYMDEALHLRIFRLFHYALNDHGFLFLGTSEVSKGMTDFFPAVDSRCKIYRRIGSPGHFTEFPRLQEPAAVPPPRWPAPAVDAGNRKWADKIIETYAPPAVLVNDKSDILYLYGPVDRYLALSPGEASFNLLDVVREGLRRRLGACLAMAFKRGKAVQGDRLRVKTGDGARTVDIIIRPVTEQGGRQMLVIFKEHEKKDAGKFVALPADAEIRAMEQELRATRDFLQTANEELQTSNEELRSTNEELQSTNEELETSKEELQSANEELVTVNSELQHKVDELVLTKEDVNNLLASTDIASLFLDTRLRIKRFTPGMVRIFRLLPADIGRPIRDITSSLSGFDLHRASSAALGSLARKEVNAHTDDGRQYAVRILPYRTMDNAVDGVVLTFVDTTALSRAAKEAEEGRLVAEGILNTMHEAFVILDADLLVRSASPGFYRLFRTKPADTLHRRIYDLGDGQWKGPRLRELLEKVIPANSRLADYRVDHTFPGAGPKTLWLNANRIAQTRSILLAFGIAPRRRKERKRPS